LIFSTAPDALMGQIYVASHEFKAAEFFEAGGNLSSDARQNERARLCSHALAHRLDEFPVGYSLASCSPAELASASPTALIVSNGPVEGKNFFRLDQEVS
jgi:hypothetical protein